MIPMDQINELRKTVEEQGAETRSALLKQSAAVSELARQTGILGEKIVNVIENNKRIDSRLSSLEVKYGDLRNTVGLNRFARDSIPKIFFALCAAVAFGFSASHLLTKLYKSQPVIEVIKK